MPTLTDEQFMAATPSKRLSDDEFMSAQPAQQAFRSSFDPRQMPTTGTAEEFGQNLIETGLPMATTGLGIALGSRGGLHGMMLGGSIGNTFGDVARRWIMGEPMPEWGEVLVTATEGAAVGFGSGLVGKAIDALWSRLSGPTTPTVDSLRAAGRKLYQNAERAGVELTPQSWAGALDDIADSAKTAGLNKHLHPRVSGVLDDLMQTKGKGLTLRELEQQRRILAGARKSPEMDERRIARSAIDKLDEYMANLSPRDVLSGSGNVRAAAATVRQARSLHLRAKKAELIGEMIETAQVNASQESVPLERALRNQFRALSRQIIKGKAKYPFSDAEKRAIKAVANGSPMGNVMRWMGRIAPSSLNQTPVGPGLAGAAGYALGGPLPAALAAGGTTAAGMLARKGAEVSTRNAARLAQELVLRGGLPPAAGPSAAVVPELGAAALPLLEGPSNRLSRALMDDAFLGARK